MSLSFSEPRLPPLGNTFVATQEPRLPHPLLRQRSFPGFFPYWLDSELQVDVHLQRCHRKVNAQFLEAMGSCICGPASGACTSVVITEMQVPVKSLLRDLIDPVDDHSMWEAEPHKQISQTTEDMLQHAHNNGWALTTAPPVVSAISICPGDSITTLMIRNLPIDILQKDLIDDLNASGFRGLYDFCYMPCSFDWSSGENKGKGYAFINFVSSVPAREFVMVWHSTLRFGMTNPTMCLNISAAAVQGLEANIAKWKCLRSRRIRNQNFRPFVAGSEALGGPPRSQFLSSC